MTQRELIKVLTKQTEQPVHSHRLVDGSLDHHLDHHSLYAQKLEARQDPTLPANLPKKKLDCW